MAAVACTAMAAAAKSQPLPLLPSSLVTSSFKVAAANSTSICARRQLVIAASANENRTAVVVTSSSEEAELESPADVVRRFYGGINSQDLSSVEKLIADQCIYEDLIFPHPFVGRKAIMEFFGKFGDVVGPDLQFVIDDISEEDSSAIGVTWHLEWKGKPFPFSKGCSFYRLQVIEGKRQISYGRDIPEPAIKPGEAALALIRGVVWLLRQFPGLAESL
ncbi:hypothetical protein MLD38_034617 [Melastoma candidum]|uniref:Uncharacterized protein n=1 Tax=Melastoma candidum TaxID=119954 RepID=A0ACB9MA87_9MYRT|nr:hypothetical protein MLD38_034617 [Melastoma candidum]